MSNPTHLLPGNVLDALKLGRTVEAIKLLREATGMGLAEAKSLVDAHHAGRPVAMPSTASPRSLPAAVSDALQRGNRVEAVRLLREKTGIGLKEAKDVVDASAKLSNAKRDALSPGEVPRSDAQAGWIAALAVAGVLAYLLVTNLAG